MFNNSSPYGGGEGGGGGGGGGGEAPRNGSDPRLKSRVFSPNKEGNTTDRVRWGILQTFGNTYDDCVVLGRRPDEPRCIISHRRRGKWVTKEEEEEEDRSSPAHPRRRCVRRRSGSTINPPLGTVSEASIWSELGVLRTDRAGVRGWPRTSPESTKSTTYGTHERRTRSRRARGAKV